jgi:hypothetical protein
MLKTITVIFLTTALLGCAPRVPLTEPVALASAKSQITFVDIGKFDRDLAASLLAQKTPVQIAFYEKVSPNQVPERLQKWISVVEAEGGKVLVEPPANELVARSPLAAIGMLGSLISSLKSFAQFKSEQIYNAAKGKNVVIALERNPKGEVLISNIQFIQRAP